MSIPLEVGWVTTKVPELFLPSSGNRRDVLAASGESDWSDALGVGRLSPLTVWVPWNGEVPGSNSWMISPVSAGCVVRVRGRPCWLLVNVAGNLFGVSESLSSGEREGVFAPE